MRQQAAGATRGVIDTAGGNRAMASAGLRSINRSTQDAIGAGLFQGRQYNDALRREVQGFNRDTSIQNAQSDLVAQQFNTQAYNQEQEYRKQSEAAKLLANIPKLVNNGAYRSVLGLLASLSIRSCILWSLSAIAVSLSRSL